MPERRRRTSPALKVRGKEDRRPFRRILDAVFGPDRTDLVWAEIGMGPPSTAHAPAYLDRLRSVLFVDPYPPNVEAGREMFKGDPRIRIIEGAVVSSEQVARGPVPMAAPDLRPGRAGSVAHVEGIGSFVPNNPRWRDLVRFEAQPLSPADVDEGDIDVLVLDAEGAEWPILRELVSRPKVLRIELHPDDARYPNPHHDKIMVWLKEHGYRETEERPGPRDQAFVLGA